jgi:predicted nucleic acid-binding protein
VIFVDSNIPMYLVGSEHPNKGATRRLLERAIATGEILVTDAEVLQEILHRYAAIARLDAIEPASLALLDVVDIVFPVERLDVEHARPLVTDTGMCARDAIHVAIMRRHGVDQILTFGLGFDGVDGVERVRE